MTDPAERSWRSRARVEVVRPPVRRVCPGRGLRTVGNHREVVPRHRSSRAELDRTGAAVTVAGVASAARVSRSWLYEQADLLADIIRLRECTADAAPIPAAQRATDDSMRQRLDTARAEIERLRTENATLRDQVARTLGEQRLHR